VPMTRILAIADEIDETLYSDKLHDLRPDLIVSCGDLPFDYLDNLVSRSNVPLLYVPGNHDPDLQRDVHMATMMTAEMPGPPGCDNLDVRVLDAAGLRLAGIGGSIRYNTGSNQYTQGEMRLRALRLEMRLRWKRLWRGGGLDVLVTHAPALGLGDLEDDAHRGIAALHRLVKVFEPRFLIHGHIHPVARRGGDLRLGDTQVVNAVPSRLLEV
jgi:Icc-related predicted phosphoesterase